MLRTLRRRRGQKGFTLIELLIVVAIIGILGTLVLPLYGRIVVKSKRNAIASEARVIYKAFKQYYVDNNAYPAEAAFNGTTLEPLVSEGYLTPAAASSFLGKLDGGQVEFYQAYDFVSPNRDLLLRVRPSYDRTEWVWVLDLNLPTHGSYWDGVFFYWKGQVVPVDQVDE